MERKTEPPGSVVHFLENSKGNRHICIHSLYRLSEYYAGKSDSHVFECFSRNVRSTSRSYEVGPV